jgi:hypothetical protein
LVDRHERLSLIAAAALLGGALFVTACAGPAAAGGADPARATPTAARPAAIPPKPATPAKPPTPASGARSAVPSPQASPTLPVQRAVPLAPAPPGWSTAAAPAGQLELGLSLPSAPHRVGERVPGIATLRNVAAAPVDLVLPCGNYFELSVRDGAGKVVYSWTRERYPTGPGLPAMPPCPRGERRLEANEGVQVPFEFAVAVAGPLTVGASRFGQPSPVAELSMTVQPR